MIRTIFASTSSVKIHSQFLNTNNSKNSLSSNCIGKQSKNIVSFGNKSGYSFKDLFNINNVFCRQLEMRNESYKSNKLVNNLWNDLGGAIYHTLYGFDNSYTDNLLRNLDELSPENKRDFINLYCHETKFPSLKSVASRMDNELKSSIHKFANQVGVEVKCIGYDCNCSIGRRLALPGADCDALFILADSKNPEFDSQAEYLRCGVGQYVHGRIVSMGMHNSPELISVNNLNNWLDEVQGAFDNAGFTNDDLKRFEKNLKDSTKDFVKAGEFNIRLAQKLPVKSFNREQFIKTSMFVEIVRDGRILENNIPPELLSKIHNSPLYKYSNLIRQQGLKDVEKQKHLYRKDLEKNFKFFNQNKKFEIIRDMIRSSFGICDAQNEHFFVNLDKDLKSEMGNIVEMYNLIRNGVNKEVDSLY